MQPQLHGRKRLGKIVQHLPQPLRRKHHVDRNIHFGLQPAQQPLHFRTQPIDPRRNRAHFGQQRAPRHGQLRLARALALKQQQPQLRLEIGHAIAYHRNRTAQLAPGAGKAAGIDDREENPQLVERRRSGIVHAHASPYLAQPYSSGYDYSGK